MHLLRSLYYMYPPTYLLPTVVYCHKETLSREDCLPPCYTFFYLHTSLRRKVRGNFDPSPKQVFFCFFFWEEGERAPRGSTIWHKLPLPPPFRGGNPELRDRTRRLSSSPLVKYLSTFLRPPQSIAAMLRLPDDRDASSSTLLIATRGPPRHPHIR